MVNRELIAFWLQSKYNLTYRCTCNLEGTIDKLLSLGVIAEDIRDIITDIYDNYERVDN